jgi:hypothetical protein
MSITTRDETKKEFIECECGTHLLEITHEIEYFDDSEDNTTRVRQEFDLEFKQCWALSNLQPLWALDNLHKGGKNTKVNQEIYGKTL